MNIVLGNVAISIIFPLMLQPCPTEMRATQQQCKEWTTHTIVGLHNRVTSRGQSSGNCHRSRRSQRHGWHHRHLPAISESNTALLPPQEKVETLDLTLDQLSQINWIIQLCKTIREPSLTDTVSCFITKAFLFTPCKKKKKKWDDTAEAAVMQQHEEWQSWTF